jgi:hypothetical protein
MVTKKINVMAGFCLILCASQIAFADGGDFGVKNGGSLCEEDGQTILCDMLDFESDAYFEEYQKKMVAEKLDGHIVRKDLLLLPEVKRLQNALAVFKKTINHISMDFENTLITINPNFEAHFEDVFHVKKEKIASLRTVEIRNPYQTERTKNHVVRFLNLQLSPKVLQLSSHEVALLFFHETLHSGFSHREIYQYVKTAHRFLKNEIDILQFHKEILDLCLFDISSESKYFIGSGSDNGSIYSKFSDHPESINYKLFYVGGRADQIIFYDKKIESTTFDPYDFILKEKKEGRKIKYSHPRKTLGERLEEMKGNILFKEANQSVFLNEKEVVLLILFERQGNKMHFLNTQDLQDKLKRFEKDNMKHSFKYRHQYFYYFSQDESSRKNFPATPPHQFTGSLLTGVVGSVGAQNQAFIFLEGEAEINILVNMDLPAKMNHFRFRLLGSADKEISVGDFNFTVTKNVGEKIDNDYVFLNSYFEFIKFGRHLFHPLSDSTMGTDLSLGSIGLIASNDSHFLGAAIDPLAVGIGGIDMSFGSDKIFDEARVHYAPNAKLFYSYDNQFMVSSGLSVLPFVGDDFSYQASLKVTARPFIAQPFKVSLEGMQIRKPNGGMEYVWSLGLGITPDTIYTFLPFDF